MKELTSLEKSKISKLTAVINSMTNMAIVKDNGSSTPKPWPSTPPEGFVALDNKQEKEVFPTTEAEQLECLRCGSVAPTSSAGAYLKHFVCKFCRLDEVVWDYRKRTNGISITIEAMEAELCDYEINESGDVA
jgi:hypothetical protein